MTEEIYRAIARATSGYVEAPAGCGKTEAIVRTVAQFCDGPQLVLTHTHAGVDALTRRFRARGVPSGSFHVDTIAGWCWGWVRHYPANGAYPGAVGIPVWTDVYAAMRVLLAKDFVRKGIKNSYTGVIVDEYQDCTVDMHALIVTLHALLPCRVLGDDLQGIFGFRDERLVPWSDVKAAFRDSLGVLETPHRWQQADNPALGEWLLKCRADFRGSREPDYSGAPIDRRTLSYKHLPSALIGLTHKSEGSICVIGPKSRRVAAATETMLVNKGFRVLEANELTALRDLIEALSAGTAAEARNAVAEFICETYGGIPADEKKFIEALCAGKVLKPTRADRKALCKKHSSGTPAAMLADLLDHVDAIDSASCKLRQSVSALKCVLEQHAETGEDLKTLYADETARRKRQSRTKVSRAIGSTLLVKGLEFDHAVILRAKKNWLKSWGGYNDLYVALTRGARSVTLLELTG